ncbi:hypothetical protein EG329_002537 [Mollisiaceae sp. DMI_Dod_QoI]|nr:hypothetical protein EG329_002537 [Helotiales sp. DMI_Dod_QoI]
MDDTREKEVGTREERKSCEEDVCLLEEFYSDNDHTILPPTSDFGVGEDSPKSRGRIDILCLPDLLRQFWGIFTSILLAIFDAVVPSFIPRWGALGKEQAVGRKHSATAYLDGLRGVATIIVYFVHFIINWFPVLRNRYGATPGDTFFLQLPIIRVFLSGRAAVASFFVISGYALSYSALTKIHKGQKTEAFGTLASSSFRRCMRLYLPCAADTFICMLLSYYGFFTHDPPHWNTIPPQLPTFSAQLADWWDHQKNLMYPFNFVEGAPYSPPYNGHLWTIPLEIRGSWVTYGTVLASANLTPAWRLVFFIGWDSYLWYMGKWDLFLFSLVPASNVPEGQACLPTEEPTVIELSTHSPDEESPWSSVSELKHHRSNQLLNILTPIVNTLIAIWPYFLFLIAMYLLSFEHVPWGVDFLLSWTPHYWDRMNPANGQRPQAWRCIGAALLAYSLSLSARPSPPASSLQSSPSSPSPSSIFQRFTTRIRSFHLQWLFTNSVSRYLGRISFGLYLMHGPVLFCFGTKLLVPAWAAYDAEMPNPDVGKYMRAFLWAAVCNTCLVIWAGDVFTRAVDERSVRLAARMAKFMEGKKVG